MAVHSSHESNHSVRTPAVDAQALTPAGSMHSPATTLAAAAAVTAAAAAGRTIELHAGPDGVIVLPEGVTLEDVLVQGRDILIAGEDGTVYVIHDGAIFVPQLVVDGVAVPPLNLAALLNPTAPQPAAGTVSSSGGNFADPVGDIQPGYGLGNLLPYTELAFPQVQEQEILPRINNKPDVTIKDGGPASHDTVDEVNENGLPANRENGSVESPGSAAGNNAHVTTGTIIIDSPDGIASVSINGVTVSGIVGQQIVGSFGTLTLGQNVNGQIAYTYTLADNTNGDSTQDVFVVIVTDPDGDTSTAKLTVDIIDDVPTAFPNTNSVSEGGTVSGNVLTDGTHDAFGADGAATTTPTGGVTGIRAGGDTGTPVTDGTTTVTTALGTLTLTADGGYTYVAKSNVVSGDPLVDHFVYTIKDADGDVSTTTLDITLDNVTVTATDSDAVVYEEGLPAGSNPLATSEVYNGSITAGGGTGPYTYTLTSSASGTYGNLVLNANGTYTYTLTKPYTGVPADNGINIEQDKDSFNYTVTDAHGNSTTGTILVDIVDDVPTANPDGPYGVVEDGASSILGNVLTNDTSGADTPKSFVGWDTAANAAEVSDLNVYGTLTLNPTTGAWSYVLDNSRAATQALAAGEVKTYTLDYTMQDADGDTSPSTLTITITGAADGASVHTAAATGPDNTVYEAGLNPDGSAAGGSSETDSGTFTVSATDGIATVVIGGQTFTLAQVQNFAAVHGVVDTGEGTLTLTGYSGSASSGTVSYSYTLKAAQDNSAPANATGLDDTVTITVNGVGGTSAHDDLVVHIVDDVPTAAISVTNLSVSLDESAGLQADSKDVAGPLAVFAGLGNVGHDPDTGNNPVGYAMSTGSVVSTGTVLGADGGTTAFSLSTVDGSSSGLSTTAGTAILLYNEGGIIVGRVGSQAGAAAFAVAINSSTGVVSVVEYLSIQHNLNGANPDDSVSITNAAISAVVTAIDGDGDKSTATAQIGNLIAFQDSAPVLTAASNINIQNAGDYAASGIFAYDLGADGARVDNNVFVAVTGAATVNGNAVQNYTISETPTESASSVSYAFSFDYSNGTGTAHESGTLTFDKVNGTYTVDLADPIQAFSIVGTAGAPASAFVNYNADGTTSNGPSDIATVGLTSNLFIQFTGDNGTISTTVAPGTSYSPATGSFGGLDLFSGSVATVTVSSSAAGVAGNTIQGGEILDFNLYATDPHGTTGGVPTGSASSMFIELDGVGGTEDMIVILKLFDTVTHQYTTQALMVQNGDIITSNATLTGTAYAGIHLDNNDGLIVIEANDYQQGNANLVIVGAQIAGSDAGISGTALNFNGALGALGDSSGSQAFSTDVSDQPFKIQNIGFVTATSTNQTANLTFNVTIQDGDGDKVTQALLATVTASADSSTPISLTSAVTSVVPIVIDLGHNGAEFLGTDAGVTYDYGHGLVSTAWAAASDGILAVDLNLDGKVSSSAEFVFGGNGLTDLQGLAATYDSNHDGILDAGDTQFASFGVWQDANANGVADEGEFHTLAELGITGIALTSDGAGYTAANGDVVVSGSTTVTFTDGSTTTAADASFAIARLSQQVESAVTSAAAGSLVTASLATLIVTGTTETAPTAAPLETAGATSADLPESNPVPSTSTSESSLLVGLTTTEQPTAPQSTGHEPDSSIHAASIANSLPDQAAPTAAEATSGDAPSHFAAAIVFDTPAVAQAMDALLVVTQGPKGVQPVPVVAAGEAAVQQALADGHAAGFVDGLIDRALGHQDGHDGAGQPHPGDAGAVHGVDLAALLSLQVGSEVASAMPQPVFDFDHAGAELLAATQA